MEIFEHLSGWATARLNPESNAWLRRRYLALRGKLHPLLRSVYGTFDAADLRRHLKHRIGDDFEILMVHSSVNKLSPMYTEGPMQLLKMLFEFCGPERTLVMPAFYFGDPKYGGARDTFAHCPRFDLRRTPSQMGLLTELFRRSKGVLASRHPVYRIAALGPLAEEVTAGHEHASTPAGLGTPFDVMARHDAQVLGIGKHCQVLTQVHHAEDLLGDAFPVPYRKAETIAMTLVDGDAEIPFLLGGRGLLWTRDMSRLRRIMNRQELREWHFHGVPLFATRAGTVSRTLIEAAARGVTIYHEA